MKTHVGTLSHIKSAVWLVAVFVLLGNSTSYADELADSALKNSLQPGSWSLQFRIDRNFYLTHFEGASISCKRHYTDRSAIRVGLGLRGYSRDEDAQDLDRRTGNSYYQDRQYNYMLLDMSALYLYYPSPANRTNLFLGIGPNLQYSLESSDNTYKSCSDTTCYQSGWGSSSRHSASAGVKCVLGVEWFASREISFLAEYSCVALYQHESTESESRADAWAGVRSSDSTEDSFRFDYGEVMFGLSVYF